MASKSRRVFMMQLAASGTALTCGGLAQASIPKADENEAKAKSLGYKHDSAKVDKARFPKHNAGEKCSGCMAWLGTPKDAWAECDLMADRLVANAGWCSSYVKLK